MKTLFVMLALIPAYAFAGADCPAYPQSEWMSETQAKAKLQKQGYKIKKFKVDGNCYEIYGKDINDKKVEIYFDTKTLAAIKAEVEE